MTSAESLSLLSQGAMPSEADLIAALRRHACWMCGALANDHDSNISHMQTHLLAMQGMQGMQGMQAYTETDPRHQVPAVPAVDQQHSYLGLQLTISRQDSVGHQDPLKHQDSFGPQVSDVSHPAHFSHQSPVSYQQNPACHHHVPVDDGQIPVGHYQASVGHHQDPVSHHHVPVDDGQIPVGHYQAPVGHHQDPVSHHHVPVDDGQIPVGHYQAPVGHHQDPVSHHHVPVDDGQIPVGHYQAPVGHHQDPVSHYQAPVGQHQDPVGRCHVFVDDDRQIPVGHHQVNVLVSHHQDPVTHHHVPVDDGQIHVGHHQDSIGYHQIPDAHQDPVSYHQDSVSHHQLPAAHNQIPVANRQIAIDDLEMLIQDLTQQIPDADHEVAVGPSSADSHVSQFSSLQDLVEQEFPVNLKVSAGDNVRGRGHHAHGHAHGHQGQQNFGRQWRSCLKTSSTSLGPSRVPPVGKTPPKQLKSFLKNSASSSSSRKQMPVLPATTDSSLMGLERQVSSLCVDENANHDKRTQHAETAPGGPFVCVTCLAGFPDKERLRVHVAAEVRQLNKLNKMQLKAKAKATESVPRAMRQLALNPMKPLPAAISELMPPGVARNLQLASPQCAPQCVKSTGKGTTGTDSKPFACEFCKRSAFRREESLRLHVLTVVHSNVEPGVSRPSKRKLAADAQVCPDAEPLPRRLCAVKREAKADGVEADVKPNVQPKAQPKAQPKPKLQPKAQLQVRTKAMAKAFDSTLGPCVIFPCQYPQCVREFDMMTNLRRHIRDHTRGARKVPDFLCIRCGLICESRVQLDLHVREHLVYSFRCKMCGYYAPDKKNLFSHQRAHRASL